MSICSLSIDVLATSSYCTVLYLSYDEIIEMFYQGDLQEGIGLAVREAKAVVCFVRGKLPALCRSVPT